MKKRVPSEEERELFERTLGDAKPLNGPRRSHRKVARAARPKALQAETSVPRQQTPASGLDGRTAERLRRGQLEPDARLDLHGLTEATAHRALLTFVKAAHMRGHRLLLVVTGKGAKRADTQFELPLGKSERGVLNEMTPRWLAEPGLASLIADTRSAHRRHGGDGALYVYLRKRT